MATTSAARIRPNGPDPAASFHQTCWRVLSAATAHGAPAVSYLLNDSAVPVGYAELSCGVCGERWAMPAGSPWVGWLRRQLLEVLAYTPAAPDAS